MRRLASWTVAGLLATAPSDALAQSQVEFESPETKRSGRSGRSDRGKRPKHGGFGFGSIGFVAGELGDLDGDLSDPIALGPGTQSPGFGYQIGGGGRMLVFHRLIVGGKGFALLAPRFGGPNGEARLVGGGGGLDIGIAMINRGGYLLYPFFGGGGFGYTLRLNNSSQQAIRFGEARPLLPGERGEYEGGFGYLDVGIGLQRLLFRDGGGFVVGFELGGMFSVSPDPWTDSNNADQTIASVEEPRLAGAYLKLTVGGGGFFME